MGTLFFIRCNECEVDYNLGKASDLLLGGRGIETEKEMEDFRKEIVKDIDDYSYTISELISFISDHRADSYANEVHTLVLCDEHDEAGFEFRTKDWDLIDDGNRLHNEYDVPMSEWATEYLKRNGI